MQIEYVATRSRRNVPDAIGETLIKRKIARRVYQTRQMTAEPPAPPEDQFIHADEPEISARTGKPKRKYRRRDMTAED